MKLRRDYIEFISRKLVEHLVDNECIALKADAKTVEAKISQTIIDDLRVEDELDAEVRKILEGYADQMRRQKIEYHEMFQMVKRKLIKERNLVL
jgi:hypothetical protein